MNEFSRDDHRSYVHRALIDHGRAYVVAAMVDGSDGILAPAQADSCVDRFLHGEDNDYCERCVSLYEFDLVEMIYDDVSTFARVGWERRRQVIHQCQETVKVDRSNLTMVSWLHQTSEP